MYHFSVKTFSRSQGYSATAAIAYRAGAIIECERYGVKHDYSQKKGIEHSQIFLPAAAAACWHDRQTLWNAAEAAETRKNSTVAREFEIAFPHELKAAQRRAMLHELCELIVERHGCAVDASIHAPDTKTGSDKRNFHAHILITTRVLEADGFTKKTRDLDDKLEGKKNVLWWREKFAEISNKHLEQNGFSTRIDHRSNADRGIDAEATKHEGVRATGHRRRIERINKKRAEQNKPPLDVPFFAVTAENERIKKRNAERKQLKIELLELEKQLKTEKSAATADENSVKIALERDTAIFHQKIMQHTSTDENALKTQNKRVYDTVQKQLNDELIELKQQKVIHSASFLNTDEMRPAALRDPDFIFNTSILLAHSQTKNDFFHALSEREKALEQFFASDKKLLANDMILVRKMLVNDEKLINDFSAAFAVSKEIDPVLSAKQNNEIYLNKINELIYIDRKIELDKQQDLHAVQVPDSSIKPQKRLKNDQNNSRDFDF